MPIQAVEPRRLYRQVADQIRALIAESEFTPDSLDADRAFHVSIAKAAGNSARAAMRSHMNLTKKRYSKNRKVERKADIRNRSAGAT